MSEKKADESVTSLKSNLEKDYLRQLEEVENQINISNKTTLVEDDNSKGLKKELNIEGNQKAEKNLIFDITDVSIFRLYFHLSNGFEYFLMIMGFIGSLATGASNPVMAYLTGSTTTEASSSTQENIESMTKEEKNFFLKSLKKIWIKK